jgi:hypothetical protein
MPTLIVAITEDGREVTINHENLVQDAEGRGFMTFTPEQARNLGTLLFLKAETIDGGRALQGAKEWIDSTSEVTERERDLFQALARAVRRIALAQQTLQEKLS